MLAIAEPDIKQRIERDNPWWQDEPGPITEATYKQRVYFEPFKSLALDFKIRRAAVLLGPRRVGKTVLVKQLIHEAIQGGIHPKSALYVSLDTPIYFGISLEKFTEFMPTRNGIQRLIVFDEIQYLKNWEVHLKDLVDAYPNIKFIVTGSAAVALD
jgi:uncharacterized protein